MDLKRRLSAVLVFLLCLFYAGGAQAVITLSPTEINATNLTVKNSPWVDVKAYGAKGDGRTDDTTAIQAAINTGKPILFPEGTYLANNLTVSTAGQTFSGFGKAIIKKNANGPIIAVPADNVTFENLQFRGEASTPVYTGDNVYATGNHFAMLNSGSRWAYGRAVKATGSHTQIYGTNDIYQTADATAAGYDIEIGVSGTATLYHELHGIYSSQRTGGILLTDTGSHTITGGEFGKLTIDSGTSPAGVNGGKTIGARILGNVTVEQSSAIFTANQFGSSTAITFAKGTSGCSLDESNVLGVGATVTNNGNTNNLIVRNLSTGSTTDLKFGDDSSAATLKIEHWTPYYQFGGSIYAPNNKNISFRNAGNTSWISAITLGSGDDLSIGTDLGTGNFTNLGAGSGGVYLVIGGTSIVQFYGSGERPQTDNIYNSGTSTQRWANVYGTNFKPGTGTVTWTSGAGTPEGVVAAPVGSLYTRTDGGAGTTLYVKESGTGNTGWVAK